MVRIAYCVATLLVVSGYRAVEPWYWGIVVPKTLKSAVNYSVLVSSKNLTKIPP